MPVFLVIGALLGCLAVMLGAFGAHGLKSRLTPEMMEIYKTGVDYHFYHVVAILAVGILGFHFVNSVPTLKLSGWFFVAGVIIFSGSLYVLAVTETRWLGAITPIGGVAFIAGWLTLAWACWKNIS